MLEHEYIPAEDKHSRCTLVALHGLGDSMEGYRFLPGLLRFPRLNCLLVNAPDEYYGGYSWYDFAGDPGPGIERSRGLLFALLDQHCANGYSAEQTILFGFSQGCLMAMEAGLRYPRRFAGVIGISGYTHEPEQALREFSPVAREQKFLLSHGTYDPMIPVGPVRAQIKLLQSAGLQIDWQEFPKEHTIAEPEIERIREFIRKQLDGV